MPKRSNGAPIHIADIPAVENFEGERKTITALLADIKGSMELIEDLDPEEARAIVDLTLKLMIEAVPDIHQRPLVRYRERVTEAAPVSEPIRPIEEVVCG